MKRRTFCLGVALTLLASPLRAIAAPTKATLYKNPECSCCEGYAAYLRENGFEVEVKPTNDLAQINQKAGVPAKYHGGHTPFVEGYVAYAHVPAEISANL